MDIMIVWVLLLFLLPDPFMAYSVPLDRMWHSPQQLRSHREVQELFHDSERLEYSPYVFRENMMRSLSMPVDYESTTNSPTPSVILDLEDGISTGLTLNFTNATDDTSKNAAINTTTTSSFLSRSRSNDANSQNKSGHDNTPRRIAMLGIAGIVAMIVGVAALVVRRNHIHRTRFRRTHFYPDPLFAASSKQSAVDTNGINLMTMDREYVVDVV